MFISWIGHLGGSSAEEEWREVQGMDSVTDRCAFSGVRGEWRRGGGNPNAELEHDRLVDGTGDTRALCRQGGHAGWIATEDV